MSNKDLKELAALLAKASAVLGAAGSFIGLVLWLKSQGRRTSKPGTS